MEFISQYLVYLFRWQLSTLTLWPCMVMLKKLPTWLAVIIANLIGGLIFFWVDKLIIFK